MILWILAIVLMGSLGVIGYYQGAIRVGFSFIGLLVGALLALPLAGLVKPVLRLVGVEHPLLLVFIAPAVVYLLILIAFKCGAVAAHRKVDTYYKYKGSDTQRSLFERLNSRLGICMGLANATVYLLLLTVVAYFFGYFTFQVSASDKDGFVMRQLNAVSEDIAKTGMAKAVAPLLPSAPLYYDGADILGFVYHNPLATQGRLSSYPAFLALAEKPEFKTLGDDVKFQQFWLESHTFGDLTGNQKIAPLFTSADLYTNVLGLLKGDLKDLKGYLETGSSAKYDDEKILGRWTFDHKESMSRIRRNKPSMTLEELRRTRAVLGKMNEAVLTAFVDTRATLRMPSMNPEAQTAQGTWTAGSAGKYLLSLADKEKKMELQASVEGNKVIVTRDTFSLVFEK
jgi:hypothetical protein